MQNPTRSQPTAGVEAERRLLQNLLLFLTMGLAATLSFYSIADKSVWLDEATSILRARLDWWELWQVMAAGDSNMGLYYVLLHFWVQLGTGEFTVRSLSAIMAIATIVPVYRIGVRLFGANTGLIASVLLVLNAFFIRYAQEARSYTLVLLLVAACSNLFLKAIEKPSVKSWGAYAAIGALSVYAHVFGAWIIAAHFLTGAAVPGLIRKRDLIVTHVVIGVLVSPLLVLILMSQAYGSELTWLMKPSLMTLAHFFGALTGYGGPGLVVLYFAVCGYALITAWDHPQETAQGRLIPWRYAFLCNWLVLPVVGSFLFSIVFKPIFEARYLIVSLPPLALITAAGVQKLRPAWLKFTVALLLLILPARGLAAMYSGRKDNWRAATKYVLDNTEAGDGIIFQAPYVRRPCEYYVQALGAASRAPQPVLPSAPWGRLDLTNMKREWLYPSPQQHRRLWLVLSHERFVTKKPRRGVLGWLPASFEGQYCLRGTRSFHGIRVVEFRLCPGFP